MVKIAAQDEFCRLAMQKQGTVNRADVKTVFEPHFPYRHLQNHHCKNRKFWNAPKNYPREEDGIRRYVHLGTGNYNDVTAKLYTDMGLLTCNQMPRIIKSICTPAVLALYKASIIIGSHREFIFAIILAFLPFFAFSVSRLIRYGKCGLDAP